MPNFGRPDTGIVASTRIANRKLELAERAESREIGGMIGSAAAAGVKAHKRQKALDALPTLEFDTTGDGVLDSSIDPSEVGFEGIAAMNSVVKTMATMKKQMNMDSMSTWFKKAMGAIDAPAGDAADDLLLTSNEFVSDLLAKHPHLNNVITETVVKAPTLTSGDLDASK